MVIGVFFAHRAACDHHKHFIAQNHRIPADFIYYGTKFLNDNLDDFLWDDKWVVRYMEGDEYKQGNVYGRTPFRKAIPDFVSNIKRMLEYHPEYTSVIIIEADTRKVSELTKEEILEY